jgi:hypothetical protein
MAITDHEVREVDRQYRIEITRLDSEIRRLEAANVRLERRLRSEVEFIVFLVLTVGFFSTLLAALAIRRM